MCGGNTRGDVCVKGRETGVVVEVGIRHQNIRIKFRPHNVFILFLYLSRPLRNFFPARNK